MRLTASNLADHLACKHLTGLDQRVRRGDLEAPHWQDPALELLKQRGIAHERAYVEHLRASGLEVDDLTDFKGQQNAQRTLTHCARLVATFSRWRSDKSASLARCVSFAR